MTAQQMMFGSKLDDDFLAFTMAHPEVVSAFVGLAREAMNRGEKYGAKSLTEVLRWTRRDLTPINNSIVSRMARYVMARHPELDGFFDLRELRA